MRAYGDNLGIAFQLVDDALDYSGRQALMGKTVGDDFREAKMTLPIILAYARADGRRQAFLEARDRNRQPDRERPGPRHHPGRADRRDPGNHDAAPAPMPTTPRRRWRVLPDSEIQRALADIADFCVERAY